MALVPIINQHRARHTAGTQDKLPNSQLLPWAGLQSHALSVPRAGKAAASILGVREVYHPRARSLKQPFVTGKEGSEENLRQKPQGAAMLLKVRGL